MTKKILIISLLIVALFAIFVGNYKETEVGVPTSDKITVTASFYPLYFLVNAIGGENINAVNITPAGVEPHDYEPTARDLVSLETSRIIFLNGGGLEPWSKTLMRNLNSKNTKVITVGEGLIEGDPHIWLNPISMKMMADKVIDGLIAVDQSNAYAYSINAAELKNKLDLLDESFRTGLSKCKKKEIVTSHDAFAYMAKAYGLKQVSIAGLSPDAEPSSRQLAEIVKFAKDKDVGYIFFESLVSPRLSDTIAEEVGAKTMTLNPLEGLSQEELASGKDYLTEMRSNLNNLKIALQCE